MDKEIKSNFVEVIDAHKQLIKFNQDKIPKHFLSDDFNYEDTIENLNKDVYKGDFLKLKYYDLLNIVGKFISRFDIDISCIKKSTVNKINKECRLDALKKVVFSEPEDETDETDDNYDNDDDETDDDDKTNNSNNGKNIKINEKDHKSEGIIIKNKNISSNNIMDDLYWC